jgi:hypothetical protein
MHQKISARIDGGARTPIGASENLFKCFAPTYILSPLPWTLTTVTWSRGKIQFICPDTGILSHCPVGRVKDEQSQLGITAICFFGTIFYGETEFTAILIFWIDWGVQKMGWKYGRKYKGFSKFIMGKKFWHLFQLFLVLSNFIAKIGWTGVIAEVQTVV